MSILRVGGEDIDFPNGSAVTIGTTSSMFRAGYARGSIYANTSQSQSNAFPGGAVTTAWLSYQLGCESIDAGTYRSVGLGNTANTNGAGIYVVVTNRTAGIAKYDGTTVTVLASGVTVFPASTFVLARMDLSITNYGASSVVNLYVNQALYASFSGSTTISGLTNFNCTNLGPNLSFASGGANASEIIVADEDTRSFSLLTMAPRAAGTTDQWTGLFSAVNPLTINDANSNFTNTVSQDQQFQVTALPSGSFAVREVKINARMAATAGSTATKVATGFNLGGTVSVGTPFGPLGTAYVDEESYYATNPVSAVAWTTTDLSTIQVDLRSS